MINLNIAYSNSVFVFKMNNFIFVMFFNQQDFKGNNNIMFVFFVFKHLNFKYPGENFSKKPNASFYLRKSVSQCPEKMFGVIRSAKAKQSKDLLYTKQYQGH